MAKLPIAVPPRASGDEGEADFSWFIYASSLDAAAFAAWSQQHGYAAPDLTRGLPARLDGFALRFDVPSRFWGGAVATVAETPGSSVEGLVLALPGSARTMVDHKEGAVSGLYEAFTGQAVLLTGGTAVEVVVYRANATRRLSAEAAPSREFLQTLIRGARSVGLTAAYVAELEKRADAAGFPAA